MKAERRPKDLVADLPQWFREIIFDFVEEYESLVRILKLTTRAISFMQLTPGILKALDDEEEEKDGQAKRQFPISAYKTMENMATMAEKEIKDGFPLIRGQVAVGLWAILEATMNNIAAGWIYHYRKILDDDSISKIKIRIGYYEKLSRRDRCEYIVDQMERDLGISQRLGVGRFEALLCHFYPTEELPPQVRKYLFELSQVRNAIVHRAYRADTSLVKNCPWLKARAGQKIKVTEAMIERYVAAVGLYVESACHCVRRNFGLDVKADFAKVSAHAKKLILSRKKP